MYDWFESGGHLLNFYCIFRRGVDGNAILKTDALDQLRQAFKSAYLAPALLGGQRQLEHQPQQGITGHAVLGAGRPMANGRKARFNRVSRPDMYPVLGRKVVKGQETP